MRNQRGSKSFLRLLFWWLCRFSRLHTNEVEIIKISNNYKRNIHFAPLTPIPGVIRFGDRLGFNEAKKISLYPDLPNPESSQSINLPQEQCVLSIADYIFPAVLTHQTQFAVTKFECKGFSQEIILNVSNLHTHSAPIRAINIAVSPCSWPMRTNRSATFTCLRPSKEKTDFPVLMFESTQNEFPSVFPIASLKKQFDLPASLSGPIFFHKISIKYNNLSIKRPQRRPLLLRLTPTDHSNTLAAMHNDLLSRIKKGLRFIGEIDGNHEKFKLLSEAVSSFIKIQGKKRATEKIWAEYSGAAVCFLVLSASYKYSHGEYWTCMSSFFHQPAVQRDWGRRFLLFLNVFGLNNFGKEGKRYLGPILGHAMIPSDCLPDLFRQLLEPALRSPAWTGRSPKELIEEWLSRSSSFPTVDKPVWQFLRHGGKIAEEFVSEALRMVTHRFETGFIQPENDLKLPLRVIHFYNNWIEKQVNPPSSRNPFLKLDPVRGILLSFPDQRLPSSQKGKICTWEIFAAGGRIRGPSGYAQTHGKEAVFSAEEMVLPPAPDGKYDVRLIIDNKEIRDWSLEGPSDKSPWMVFSGRNYKAAEISRPISADSIWILMQDSAVKIAVRDKKGIELAGAEKQCCHMIGEWDGYMTTLFELASAVTLEISWNNFKTILDVEYPETKVILEGGDLIQASVNSPDHVDLYGKTLPQLLLQTKQGQQTNLIYSLKIRIAGQGIEGYRFYEPSLSDVKSAYQEEAGRHFLNIEKLIIPELSPGDLTFTMWHGNNRLNDFHFRWMPNLFWEWTSNGKSVNIFVPETTVLSVLDSDEIHQPSRMDNQSYTVELPHDCSEVDLNFSWPVTGKNAFSIPFRLFGPRWAFLKQYSAIPIFQTKHVEMSPDDLLQEDAPFILLECRDLEWQKSDLRAQWIGDNPEAPTLNLTIESLPKDRWLIRLADIADTLRKFQNINSHIIVTVYTSKYQNEPILQVSVIKLLAPISFRWSFQADEDTAPVWNDVCIEVDVEKLIQAASPHLIFELNGGDSLNTDIIAFWRPIDDKNGYEIIPSEINEKQGRWSINLTPAIDYVERFSGHNSEIWVEIKGIETDAISLIRILYHHVAIKTYEECIQWASGNNLRGLVLDFLCGLNHNRWTSLQEISEELKISSELVKDLIRIIRIECPEVTISERQNKFAINKASYQRITKALTKWDQSRRWKE